MNFDVRLFSGERCELKNSCVTQPCQHDGICINQGDDHHCQCKQSYYGKNCDQGKEISDEK